MATDNGGNGQKRKSYHEQKERVFVRAIAGEYNLTQELARLRSLPRVIKGRETPFFSGPQQFSKHYLEPKDGLGQTLRIHLEEYSPGGKSQKHGHVNEAVMKTKPMYVFMNMLLQQMIEKTASEPTPRQVISNRAKSRSTITG